MEYVQLQDQLGPGQPSTGNAFQDTVNWLVAWSTQNATTLAVVVMGMIVAVWLWRAMTRP